MEFSIATLLSHLTSDKLVAGKVLEKKLDCQDDVGVERLQIVLDVLERIGLVAKERGKYRRQDLTDCVEAKLRCSSKGFCFAIQDEEDAEDIYIRESHLNHAWNGDRVLVRITKDGNRRRSPEGEVRVILDRANPSLLAKVVQKETGEYKALPLDDRLLFEVSLAGETDTLTAATDHLVHVSVVRYPIAQLPPVGKVTKVLGSDAEAAADTDIVCCKHDLPLAFGEVTLAAAAILDGAWSPEEEKNRLDLRDRFTLSLGMATDRLVDQAFGLQALAGGQWELAIHLADLAHHIPLDSPLDRAARKRGTAISLGEEYLPLLPAELAPLLGLVSGQDRLALSLLITLDEAGQVVRYDLRPSVVRVDQHLTYGEIQDFLSGEKDALPDQQAAVALLRDLLFKVSPLVKAQRLQQGGFHIAVTGLPNLFLDEGHGRTIVIDPSQPVRGLVMELAILAGKLVAQHLQALQVPALFCSQGSPDDSSLGDVLRLAQNLGLDLALASEEEITPLDYQRFTQAFESAPASKVLYYLLLDSIKPAKYLSHSAPYFGLAHYQSYTHVIMPGYRYADLTIQRLLKLVGSEGRDRRHPRSKQGVDLLSSTCHGEVDWPVLPAAIQTEWEALIHELVPHLNDRDKVAEDAEKDLLGLQKAEKMKAQTGQVFQGVITGVQSYGFFVEIEEYLVEGLVHVSSLKDDWYEYRARHNCLVGRKNQTAYRLGDLVDVEVKSVDYYRQQIDLATVRGGSSVTEADLEEEEN